MGEKDGHRDGPGQRSDRTGSAERRGLCRARLPGPPCRRRRRSRCRHAAGNRARAEPGARLRRTGCGPFPERRPASRSARDAGKGTQARSPGNSPRRAQGPLPGVGSRQLRRGGPDSASRARARPAVRAGPGAPRRRSLGRTGPARGSRGTRGAGGRTRSRQRNRLAAPGAELHLGRRSRERVGCIQQDRGSPGPCTDDWSLVPERMARGRRAGLRSDRRRADLFPGRGAGCARHTQARARDG